jgi:hypothetical protein
MEDVMTAYKLTRTGQASLAFEGEELAVLNGHWANGQEQNRWHDLAVYRTSGGNYVLRITYCTQWQGEQSHDEVVVLGQDARGLADALCEYDPIARLQGYPPGTQYAEKQARLQESLRQRYAKQSSDLLDKIPGTEEVLP